MANDERRPWYLSPAGIVVIVILAVLAISALSVAAMYNGLVNMDVNAQNKWADVEVNYQRRADLIPQVVNATRGYMQFERGLLTDVTNARSQWGTAKTQEEQIAAGNSIDSAISRLLLVYENYPTLKSDGVVRDLMTELEGSQNRISVAQRDYNAAAAQYNAGIRTFPSVFVANMFGFGTPKELFKAKEGADNPPPVQL